jgi:hypothetical protein
MPIIPSTPKLCCFGQNGIVLQILGIFFFEKKKEFKKKKKKKGESQGGRTTPFWPRGG